MTASASEGVVVGEEEARPSVDIFRSNLNLLFPRNANYHWLKGDYPVIIMSTTHHARVLLKKILKPITQAIYISNTIGPNLIGTANAEVIIMRR